MEFNDILVMLSNSSCNNHFSKNLHSCFLGTSPVLINTLSKKVWRVFTTEADVILMWYHSLIPCFINYFNVLCFYILT